MFSQLHESRRCIRSSAQRMRGLQFCGFWQSMSWDSSPIVSINLDTIMNIAKKSGDYLRKGSWSTLSESSPYASASSWTNSRLCPVIGLKASLIVVPLKKFRNISSISKHHDLLLLKYSRVRSWYPPLTFSGSWKEAVVSMSNASASFRLRSVRAQRSVHGRFLRPRDCSVAVARQGISCLWRPQSQRTVTRAWQGTDSSHAEGEWLHLVKEREDNTIWVDKRDRKTYVAYRTVPYTLHHQSYDDDFN